MPIPEAKIAKDAERIRKLALYNGDHFSLTEGSNYDADDRINTIMEKMMKQDPGLTSIPAVDLNPGLGVLTTQWALRYRAPQFPISLDWYPCAAKVEKTKDGLAYLCQEALTRNNEILFHDKNGKPVHAKDIVQLRGLSNANFNEKEGQIIQKDDKQEGRYAVVLMNEARQITAKGKKISIKQENVFAYPANRLEIAVLEQMQQDEEKTQQFFGDLADRTRKVDLDTPGTWKNIADLSGKCALVTYTDYEESASNWHEAIFLADKLLMEDGFLIMFGKVSPFGRPPYFGNIMTMEKATYGQGCKMALDHSEPGWVEDSDTAISIWRKVPPNYDRIAEMDRLVNNKFMYRTRFKPTIPGEEDSAK